MSGVSAFGIFFNIGIACRVWVCHSDEGHSVFIYSKMGENEYGVPTDGEWCEGRVMDTTY